MPERVPGDGEAALSVGPFTLTSPPRRLLFAGQAVALDALSLEVLAVLAEHRGDIVDSADLIARVEGEATVDEVRLFGCVAAINKAIEERVPTGCYIAHFPNEGFILVVPDGTEVPRRQSAPSRLTSIIGRTEAVEQVVARLREHRFVTIVGTGGIGKTTVALAVAQALDASFDDGICFVDLSPVADAAFVPGTVASALGLFALADSPLSGPWAGLRDKNMLVVLDSCEHVIGGAARVAQSILAGGAQVAVLATSREPLRASGEWVEPLLPMRLPTEDARMSAADALRYPAIELFVERARAAKADFGLEDSQAAPVVALCRRLDGIPLAIEIVAARVAELGVLGLAAQVESRGLELTSKRRSLPSRHHTMSALLDWSYESLSEVQQSILQRLSVFRGNFSCAAARAVVVDDGIDAARADGGLVELVAKSLLTQVTREPSNGLRLLDTTRAYAARKLEGSGERKRILARHAKHLIDLLADAEGDWERMTRRDWLGCYAPWIDDVRSALDWAFSADGDASIGIALTMSSFALVRQMGLDVEFVTRFEKSLELFAGLPSLPQPALAADTDATRSREAMLVAALERTTLYEEPAVAARHRIAFLERLWISAAVRADFPAATRLSARIGRIARSASDPIGAQIAMRVRAQSLHFIGHHKTAGSLAQQLLAQAPRKIPLGYSPSPIDARVWMRIILARILWLKGAVEQAATMARECVERARTNSPMGHFQALAFAAIPIALWSGRDAAIAEAVESIREIASANALAQWQPWGDRYRDALSLRRLAKGAREEVELARPHASDANLQDHLCTFDARFVTAAAVERVNAGTVGWCAAEILRVHGERMSMRTSDDPAADGEAILLRSLALARRQEALSWELRTATSLARRWQAQGRAEQALDLLAPIHARLAEGRDTPDWLAASSLLATL